MPILAQLRHRFVCFVRAFIRHRFLIESLCSFQPFLDTQNNILFWKTQSLKRFTFYYLNMTKHRFLGLFRHHFRNLFVSFPHTFSLPIFFYVLGCHFDDFASKMVSKRLALCALLVAAAASFQRPGLQTRFRFNFRAISS